MFYVIKDDKLYEYGDNVNSAWDYPEEAQELAGVTLFDYQKNVEQYKVRNGKLANVSQTDEYKAKIAEERKKEIETELETLDIKCIRAMREGGTDIDGISFLDKYQVQISALREEYNSL